MNPLKRYVNRRIADHLRHLADKWDRRVTKDILSMDRDEFLMPYDSRLRNSGHDGMRAAARLLRKEADRIDPRV